MSIEIKRFVREHEAAWNHFVGEGKAHFFFDRSFMEYHQDRFHDHSLLFYCDSKILGILPANEDVENQTMRSHQGLTFGGFIWTQNISLQDALDCWSVLIEYLRQNGFKKLVYKMLPDFYSEFPTQESLYCLFRHDAQLSRVEPNTVIDLTRPLRLNKGKKYGVNVSKKAGIKIREVQNADQFYDLLAFRLAERFDSRPTHTADEIKLLLGRFPKNMKIFGAFDGDDLVAGTLVLFTERVVHTQYMATSEKGRKLCALDYLIAEGIVSLADGRKYLSFGISTENGGAILNEGLLRQKEGFGGRTFAHLTFEVNVDPS